MQVAGESPGYLSGQVAGELFPIRVLEKELKEMIEGRDSIIEENFPELKKHVTLERCKCHREWMKKILTYGYHGDISGPQR